LKEKYFSNLIFRKGSGLLPRLSEGVGMWRDILGPPLRMIPGDEGCKMRIPQVQQHHQPEAI